LVRTVGEWNRLADYSHGYLVIPIAVCFLWMRRYEFPRNITCGSPWGWAFIAAAVAIRIGAGLMLIESLDGWTIPLWIAGVVLIFGGWKLLVWSGPAIAFLWFAFPIPYSAELALSQPLQGIATGLSTAALQILGQGAIAEGHTILVGEHVLEVEQACSGLRIFVGVFALAFAYVLFIRRTWWEKSLLLASAVPVALVANSTRIVITGLLFQYVSGDAAKHFTHEISGWAMIPFAAALFAGVAWYAARILPEVDVLDTSRMLAGELR
jgi:exosortase